jgi:hypothetical protein
MVKYISEIRETYLIRQGAVDKIEEAAALALGIMRPF